MKKVYFIKPIGMDGPVKIGCSQSPSLRRSALETWCPFPLEIVAEIVGDAFIESRFHRKFLASHLRSEWFAASPELSATIQQINDGLFDASTLPQFGGLLGTLKASNAEYGPLDLQFADLHHRLTALPYSVRWKVQRGSAIAPSISAFTKLRPETKARHIERISAALEKAAA